MRQLVPPARARQAQTSTKNLDPHEEVVAFLVLPYMCTLLSARWSLGEPSPLLCICPRSPCRAELSMHRPCTSSMQLRAQGCVSSALVPRGEGRLGPRPTGYSLKRPPKVTNATCCRIPPSCTRQLHVLPAVSSTSFERPELQSPAWLVPARNPCQASQCQQLFMGRSQSPTKASGCFNS